MHTYKPLRSRHGFTLIELLVVIAIIAILAVVVVLTLNPAELLRQGRDSNRVSDMDTLAHAISLYQTDQGGSVGYTMGNASSVYISIPDTTISGNTTSTCTSLNLPALSSGYTYQCTSPQSYKNVNGSGWIPVNFNKMSAGSPLGSLPADPTNNTSTGLYYSYYSNGSQYEITSLFESQKYKAQYAQNPLDTYYPEVNAKGSSLAISPLFNPSGLVGYWPMDEGSGTTAYDQSGNGNNGTWGGSLGNQWTFGKVGKAAGYPNNVAWVNLGNPSSLQLPSSISVFAWVKRNSINDYERVVMNYYYNIGGPFSLMDGGSGVLACDLGNYALNAVSPPNVFNTVGVWYYVGCTYDGNVLTTYMNGVAVASSTGSVTLSYSNGFPWAIGSGLQSSSTSQNTLTGIIDDVRIYNRALPIAEVQALYNSER